MLLKEVAAAVSGDLKRDQPLGQVPAACRCFEEALSPAIGAEADSGILSSLQLRTAAAAGEKRQRSPGRTVAGICSGDGGCLGKTFAGGKGAVDPFFCTCVSHIELIRRDHSAAVLALHRLRIDVKQNISSTICTSKSHVILPPFS